MALEKTHIVVEKFPLFIWLTLKQLSILSLI